MISVGDAVLKLGVDTRDLDKGMQGVGDTIKKHHKAIGMAMTAAGGAILAAGALSVKTYAEMGDEVQKMALRTGFGAEALSELRHAAKLSGAELTGIEKASRTLSGAITDAGFGLETYVRAFAQIGLAYEDLAKLSPEDQFLAVMEALAGVEDETLKAAIAADLMGRSGTAMLPMLAKGAAGLAEMRQEAHELGIVFDQEAAEKAAEFTDSMERVSGAASGLKMAIAENLIPAIMPLIVKVKEVVSGISAWMKGHPELARVITLTTIAAGLLMVVLGPLLIFLPQITAAFSIMQGFMLTKLIPSIVSVTAALWAKVAALYAAMVAMGPAGWAMAATSMALIATGLVVIIKKARESTGQFTDEISSHIPKVERASSVTREWSENLSKLEKVTRTITEAQDKLSAVEEKLTEQGHNLNLGQTFLIRTGENLEEILRREALATEGLTQADEDYVDILLTRAELNNEQLQFLRDYVKAKEDATEAEKKYQKELEDTNKLLEEQQEAYKSVIDKIEETIEALNYERSEAGELRLGVEDVISALYLMGESNEYIAQTLISLGDEQNNVIKVMEAFGLTAQEIAKILDMQTESVARLSGAYGTLGKSTAQYDEMLALYEAGRGESGYGDLWLSPEGRAAIAEDIRREQAGHAAYEARVAAGTDEWATSFQHGGIITRPTLGLLAEAGPEAVIPLNKGGINIFVELDGRTIAQAIGQPLVDEIRLRTGVR